MCILMTRNIKPMLRDHPLRVHIIPFRLIRIMNMWKGMLPAIPSCHCNCKNLRKATIFQGNCFSIYDEKEQDKIYYQVIAEGKASDKKIYVKKLQEKRTAINIIYNMTTEKNGKRGVLAIAAEPAGPKDTTVESEPANAQSQKLKVSGQEVVYTPIDKMEYKSVAWMNPKTRVNYIIRETGGHLTKEDLIALAGQIIEASA